jgi:hypothetical protein
LQELGVRFVIFTLVDHDEWFGGPLICQAGRMGIAVGKEVTTFSPVVWDVKAQNASFADCREEGGNFSSSPVDPSRVAYD